MFERKLAWRYIHTQKHHSVLTVCSIAVAIALMTMLFTSFSTVIGCFRDLQYEYYPCHISVSELTHDQAEKIAELVGDDGKCTINEYPAEWNGRYYVYILFNGYIGDSGAYMEDLLSRANISTEVNYFDDGRGGSPYVGYNDELMTVDMIDLSARYQLAQIFAIFYLFVIFIAIALRLVMDTAFEVSSRERERQFGVLQSIGATPRQTVGIITFEGLILSAIGIPIGIAAGIALGYAAYRAVLSTGIAEAYLSAADVVKLLHFHVSPLLILIGALTGLIWVMLSAYATGMRIIKMSPVQAISSRSNTVKKVKKHSLFGLLFGWEGKLASRNNMRQKKRFIITVLSLTISITLFAMTAMIMDCVKVAYQEQLELEYDQSEDFEFSCQNDDDAKLTYQEQIELLTESGYFTDISLSNWQYAYLGIGDDLSDIVHVEYFDENRYNKVFDNDPPVSYEELTEKNGYVLMRNNYYYDEWEGNFTEVGAVPLMTQKMVWLTDEEYAELSPEDQESVLGRDDGPYLLLNHITGDFEILGAADIEKLYTNYNLYIAGSLDSYVNSEYQRYSDKVTYINMYCNLADGASYLQVMDFISENQNSGIIFGEDMYSRRQQLSATISAIRIASAFLIIMLALIAVVNMVNILSTGILNRRGEIAAMQCAGMTRQQLYSMTIVECLQYAISSGAISLILSELLMLGTKTMLGEMFYGTEVLEKYAPMLSYSAPLPKIAIAALAAFAVALTASLLPLRASQKVSLVEQIRRID